MTINDIREGVLTELAQLLSLSPDEMAAQQDQSLEDLGVDSLMMLEFFMNVEKRFQLPEQEDDFDDEWMQQFKKIDDVVRFVAETHDVPLHA